MQFWDNWFGVPPESAFSLRWACFWQRWELGVFFSEPVLVCPSPAANTVSQKGTDYVWRADYKGEWSMVPLAALRRPRAAENFALRSRGSWTLQRAPLRARACPRICADKTEEIYLRMAPHYDVPLVSMRNALLREARAASAATDSAHADCSVELLSFLTPSGVAIPA